MNGQKPKKVGQISPKKWKQQQQQKKKRKCFATGDEILTNKSGLNNTSMS